MALQIETFDNRTGGQSYFKALGHPHVVEKAKALLSRLQKANQVAIYDPLRMVEPFQALYPMDEVRIAGVFVQDIDHIASRILGHSAAPVTTLIECPADVVFIPSFDAVRLAEQAERFLPKGASIVTLDEMMLEAEHLTNSRRYLDPLNFATNFAFFRDDAKHHTRLTTANYWGGYGGKNVKLWCTLLDQGGAQIAEWVQEAGPKNASIVIDSREIRARFSLAEFCGQLFIHVIGAAGHDVVKYALDTYGAAPEELSCTHDANAWPADLYGGLPAPDAGETVYLWVQNSHPTPIPRQAIGLNRMGRKEIAWLDKEIPAFASYKLNVSDLVPDVSWPAHLEIQAGKHFVRPRYEITKANGRNRISHPNVERVDLKPDPRIPELSNLMGKGYLLPAPILSPHQYKTEMLPTPMSTAQQDLPVAVIAYDMAGREINRHAFGALPRDHDTLYDLSAAIADHAPEGGHAELVYDFQEGGEADGWLHAIFRYTDRVTGHAAETSFGAHMFNHILTYKDEPQSYASRPPGLSTRLFLRLAPAPTDAFCCLIYSSSTEWAETSDTVLSLCSADGSMISEKNVQIPLNGSYRFTRHGAFDDEACAAAGDDGYILIRDASCRLFGYHGLINEGTSFSLDHMFGF